MRYSQAFIPTQKEVPADAKVPSHQLMVRGGYIRKLAAGIYNFLPLGWRVIRKIESVIQEEMDAAGAQQVLMPAATPSELWEESGRWEKYGPELLRFKDRKGSWFCVGPTHEEVIVDMVRRDANSYRNLPLNLYQIQTKFRDELRPRAGLMRGREFIMKDAYSFDVDESAANVSYDKMYAAYERIFARCGLSFRAVEADQGAIGGSRSHEFQVLADTGEDAIVACSQCDYAANVEQAEVVPDKSRKSEPGELTMIDTPGKKTIDEVASFLNTDTKNTIKALVYLADEKPVMVCVRGDRAVNEVALKKVLGATTLFLAREKQVVEAVGVKPGAVGPVGAKIPVYLDSELEGQEGLVSGAGEENKHYTGVSVPRDVPQGTFAPLRMATAGDACPRCDGVYEEFRGIEVGHVFFLGTAYSNPLGCTFLDEEGAEKDMVMGCYGIGVTRIAAAAIEQNHDKGGICWPFPIAPYHVTILPLQMDNGDVVNEAEQLYQELKQQGVEVLIDDRQERAGAKFADADLIGIPLRIALGGRGLKEGMFEAKWRHDSEVQKLPIEGAAAAILGWLAEEKAKFEL